MKTTEELARTMTSFQVEKLLEIVIDFHWMARRYAEGRSTYCPSLLNSHVRALQAMEIPLNETADKALFAQDGMGRAYDGLEDTHTRLAQISKTDTQLAECSALYIEEYNPRPRPDSLIEAYEEWKAARRGESC